MRAFSAARVSRKLASSTAGECGFDAGKARETDATAFEVRIKRFRRVSGFRRNTECSARVGARMLTSHRASITRIKLVRLGIASLLFATVPACTSYYRTPGGPAPIGEMTAPTIAEKLRAQPESPIPATIALVRVQEGYYSSRSVAGVRRGGVSIVTADDLELPEDVQQIAKWPEIRAITRLTAVLVPQARSDSEPFSSMLALREGAASLHADILALYTIDTTFRVDDFSPGALGLVTLGLAPTKSAVVNSTASLAFIDVRTGFVYGTAEASARDDQAANSWTSEDAIDQCRRRVERESLVKLFAQAQSAWAEIAAARKAELSAAKPSVTTSKDAGSTIPPASE